MRRHEGPWSANGGALLALKPGGGCYAACCSCGPESLRHPGAGDVPQQDLGEHKAEPGGSPSMQPLMLGAMQPF